jgi:hypothetical protein
LMRTWRGPGVAAHGPRDGGLGGGGHPVADRDPIDKGKVNEVVFDLLDHLDEWYGQDAEIGHLLVVARVTDAGGERCTDVVTSAGTTRDEVLGMLRRAHDIYSRPAARTVGGEPGRGGWWRRVLGGRARTRDSRG